jgi:hypothetical protein
MLRRSSQGRQAQLPGGNDPPSVLHLSNGRTDRPGPLIALADRLIAAMLLIR